MRLDKKRRAPAHLQSDAAAGARDHHRLVGDFAARHRRRAAPLRRRPLRLAKWGVECTGALQSPRQWCPTGQARGLYQGRVGAGITGSSYADRPEDP